MANNTAARAFVECRWSIAAAPICALPCWLLAGHTDANITAKQQLKACSEEVQLAVTDVGRLCSTAA